LIRLSSCGFQQSLNEDEKMNTPSNPIIYRPKQIREMFSWSRHAHENAMKHEGFPRPIQLGPRAVGFLKTEIDKWLEGRIADRDAA